MDPFSAFLLHRGMRTLAVRMEAHSRGALELARWSAADPRVEAVHHPALPGHPDRSILEQQMDGVGSLVSIPARMSHRSLDARVRREIGIPDRLVRLSVGLESESDLIADLDQALGERAG